MADIAGISNGRERWGGLAQLPRHRHDTPYAAIVLSGGYEECGSRGRFRVRPGDVLLHDAFDAHLDRFDRTGAETFNIALPRRIACSLAQIADPDAIVRLAQVDSHAAGLTLCAQIAPCALGSGDWPDQLAGDLLDDPDCRLGDWAQAHGLAGETVSRGFARVFGLSPAAFRAEARARRALAMIVDSVAPLAAIAAETGFADQAHMSRAIRALTGVPPGRWRTSKPYKTGAQRTA